ncbi:putative glycerol kinase 5 [Polypterus senegalus]|uniref:putative glycerol kinase 5 n=1 Tax=Polypterus senegalus TaxID=55291 RepID=UPI0019668667|nr:putative glycerol kinase 5 [Polypterus senegalus]
MQQLQSSCSGNRRRITGRCKMRSCKNGMKTLDGYVLSVDVGTTTIRGYIYDRDGSVRGASSKKIKLLYPKPGWVEIDPEELWQQFVSIVKEAVQAAGLQMKQILTLGISTQRATFTTWSKETRKPFHNFISWQDLRATELVKSWNSSYLMKVIHGCGKMLHFLTRQKRFLAASIIKFSTQHVTFRLAWVLQNIKQVQEAVIKDDCCFGTIDTWLLYRLTNGVVHATDYSNASSTGIYDSYQLCWSEFFCSLISLPLSIFPKVENTSHSFGTSDPEIFDYPIHIKCLVADQQAAMFGECCFNVGDIKITMGTGTFMDINTGSKPHTSIAGLYPVIGWKIGQELVYLAEGNAADTGTAVKWAQQLSLFSDAAETETMATNVSDSEGVCFVPSFSGLQAPLNDPRACASFMGLKPTTTKNHLVRAILESIAFRNKQLYETMIRETCVPVSNIRADGGVCSNNFVMQLTSDLLNQKIDRPKHVEMSSLGAAFIAGLGIGFWSNTEELKCLRSTEKVFLPKNANKNYEHIIDMWEEALKRSMHWYSKR